MIVLQDLLVIKKFLSAEAEAELLNAIDGGCWSTELGRRVQHFGYRYNYKARRISSVMKADPFPEWVRNLTEMIIATNITSQQFDQLIINEYFPGQGIAAHVDCIPCFDNEIVSLSLGSTCVMTFSNPRQKQTFDVLLEPGDLMLMRDKARYEWLHQISARKKDKWEGRLIERKRRVSVTLRKILLQEE